MIFIPAPQMFSLPELKENVTVSLSILFVLPTLVILIPDPQVSIPK